MTRDNTRHARAMRIRHGRELTTTHEPIRRPKAAAPRRAKEWR